MAEKDKLKTAFCTPFGLFEIKQMPFALCYEHIITAPVLAYADFKSNFVLEVDASHGGLGAVLSQEQEGKFRSIAYASLGLRPT